jgi:hypothetical protein
VNTPTIPMPPALATALLLRLGSPDAALVGDLAEEYRAGRSRAWYWRQVGAAIVLGAAHEARVHPFRLLAGVAAGWALLILIFTSFGDRTADAAAGWIWNWDRQTAYATGVWWPFQITAVVVSYAGFALSALMVVRLHRPHAGPMVVAYALSMFVALVASAIVIEILTQRIGRVPVPHPLFYIVSVTLPTHLRSGLLLAPLTILAIGALGSDGPARERI